MSTTTWFRATARNERLVPVQVTKVLPATGTLSRRLYTLDEHGAEVLVCWQDEGSVRYFPAEAEALAWVDRTLVEEIEELTQRLRRLHEV